MAKSEKGQAQPHFIDLCHALGEPTPQELDPDSDFYVFEKRVSQRKGGKGFAAVWYRDHFGWEYKSADEDLVKAYVQLDEYRADLDNPPLLVVCDLQTFEVHTNFTGTKKRLYKFGLTDLLSNQALPDCPLPPLDVLRALFENPENSSSDPILLRGTRHAFTRRILRRDAARERHRHAASGGSDLGALVWARIIVHHANAARGESTL